MAAQDVDPASGAAVLLLQAQLGAGLALAGLAASAGSSADLRKLLDAAAWEPAVRRACAVLVPASTVASAALLQAAGAAPSSMVATLGLLACTGAIILGAAVALLEPGPSGRPGSLAQLQRVLRAVLAAGQLGFAFSPLPGGPQLLAASLLTRGALLAQAAGGAASTAIPSGALSERLQKTAEDAARFTNFVPLFSAVAIVDHISSGPSCMLMLAAQPSLWVFKHMCLVVALGTQEDRNAGFNAVSRALICLAAIAACVACLGVLAQVFTVSVSTTGVSVTWGELLAAATAKMSTIIIGFYIVTVAMCMSAGTCCGSTGEEGKNGEDHPRKLQFIDFMKLILAPAQVLVLGMAAGTLTLKADEQAGSGNGASHMALRAGFVLSAWGVGLQVASLLYATAAHAGEELEEVFDAAGALKPASSRGRPNQPPVAVLRFATHAMLQGGLFLACLGLGAVSWVVLCLAAPAFVYAMASAEARDAGLEVVRAWAASVTENFGASFAFVDQILEKNRVAREAAREAAAARNARALEEESTRAAGSPERPAGRGSKAAPASGSAAGGANKKKSAAKRR